VTFGPSVQGGISQKEIKDKAREMLSQMGLQGIENNYPSEISSGMRRRVEIARAMMKRSASAAARRTFRAMDALTKPLCHQFLPCCTT